MTPFYALLDINMEQLAVLHVHVNKHRETQPHAWEGDNKTCEKSCDPWFVRPRPNVPLLGRSWASAQEHRERCWKWHAGHDRSTQMQVGERAAGRKHRRLVSVNALSQDWDQPAMATELLPTQRAAGTVWRSPSGVASPLTALLIQDTTPRCRVSPNPGCPGHVS